MTWLVTMILAGAVAVTAADQSAYGENQVKGAFLAKFALFVEWPAEVFPGPDAPITIGLLGADPFGPQYEAALGRELVQGRRFRVKRFNAAAEIKDCHIVFVSGSESNRLTEILAAFEKRPVLVVGDQDRFAHRGGMLNFVKEDGKVRFEVNVEAIERSRLRMSSKLLQVARPVKPEPGKVGV